MRRKNLILQLLEKNTRLFLNDNSYNKLDATSISELLDIARYNVSRDLNQLLEENKVIKISGRPVYFMSKEQVENKLNRRLTFKIFESMEEFKNVFYSNELTTSEDYPFSELVGYSGSLANAVRQAKAALLYPPNGLHTLLTGPSGSGKTTFARFMYEYSLQNGQMVSTAPYVVFNCADYSNNQHLLLDLLFGHVKHAYTGAETDKSGLIEAADNGILFLDEIHRLPPEGQEMLFSVIDRGEFYRLGESGRPRKVNVLIIGATTEDIQKNILTTFIRRIPLTIYLPSINERGLNERIQLIYFLFKQEAKKIKQVLEVNEDVIRFFLQYEPQGNIGQLKNDIQFLCANALVDSLSSRTEVVTIKLSHLSNYLIDQFYFSHSSKQPNNEVREKIKLLKIGNLMFTPDDREEDTPFLFINNDELSNEVNEIYEQYLDGQGALSSLKNRIQGQENKLVQSQGLQQPILKIVSRENFEVTLNILKRVAKQEDYYFDDKNIENLALHLDTLIEKVNEGYSFRGEKFTINRSEQLIANENKEIQVANKIYQEVSSQLNVELPESEVYFISLYLKAMNENYTKNKIGVLVLMHGEFAATDLANTANQLLTVNHAVGLDMPLSQSVGDILEKATGLVKELDQGKGVILLSDMGSLNMFGELITKKTGIATCTIKMVTTPMVVEAARKAMLPEMTIERLEKDIIEQSTFIGNSVQDEAEQPMSAGSINLLDNRRTKVVYILEESLTFLDGSMIYDLLENVAKQITIDFSITNYDSFWIKFLFHTSNMLERAIRKEQFLRVKVIEYIKADSYLYNYLRTLFTPVENQFGIKITDDEISYIMELMWNSTDEQHTSLI